jgi:hypothetical protein
VIDLAILARALDGEVAGGQVLAPGPGHSAKDRSLAVKLDLGAPDGFVVFSHAGDDPIPCRDHVRSRLGLPPFKPNGRGTSEKANRRIVARYPYVDETGALLYEVVRYEPKDFRQRRPDGNGGWIWNLGDIKHTLYRLPDVLADLCKPREEQGLWFLCEGEKDVETLVDLCFQATTNSGGAGNFRPELAWHFRDAADLVILEDADSSGAAAPESMA